MLIKSACQILKTTARKVVPDQICQEKNLLAGMMFAVCCCKVYNKGQDQKCYLIE